MKQNKRKREAKAATATVAGVAPAGEPSDGRIAEVRDAGREQSVSKQQVAEVVVEVATNGDRAAEHGGHKQSAAAERTPQTDRDREYLYTMSASCTVRDSVALKSTLLDLIAHPQPVTIDARAVERIDTAALQVLCAFVRDRRAAGGEVAWIGGNENFDEAIRLLGLQNVLGIRNEAMSEAAS